MKPYPSGPGTPRLLSLALLAACYISHSLHAATYYVDSLAGNDTANGTSITTPWKSSARVNSITFQPGDSILFKRSGTYPGHLHPSGNGAEGSPIVIGAYGEGGKPIIDGQGNFMPAGSTSSYLYMDINVNYGGSAMSFRDQDYWEIKDIAIRNKGASEAIRRGLFISLTQGVTFKHWKITGCTFYDINGWNGSLIHQGKSLGGITFLTSAGTTNDLVIENNEFHSIRGGALWIACGKGGVTNNSLWGTGLVIRNNVIRDIGTLAMLVCRAKGALIEHNVAYRCHKNGAAGGMWNAETEGAVFQYNEWYDDGQDGQDGTAFDPDVRTSDTTIQYNYVHDAQGLVCFYTDEAVLPDIVRYNVCVNLHTGSSGIVRFRNGHPTQVYNNTFYITSYTPAGGRKAFDQFSSLASSSHAFNNNLVYVSPLASNFEYGDALRNAPASRVSHNCFAGEQVYSVPTGDQVNTLRGVDPLFVNPGPSAPGFATCENYKLRPSSPCIDKGKIFLNSGGRDFYGTPLVDGATDIGAHEFAAQIPPSTSLAPEADAYVRKGYTTNFGSEPAMWVCDGTNYGIRMSFIRFDVSGLASGNGTHATLVLTVTGLGTETNPNRTIHLAEVGNDAWSESTIKWSTKPLTGNIIGTFVVGAGDVGAEIAIDVTTYVNAQRAGDGLASFVLLQPTGANGLVKFGSKESASPPALEIQ